MIPDELIRANELQKIGDYKLSGSLYQKFFDYNPQHPLRFKALFEVADNFFHAGCYEDARNGYELFLSYCAEQRSLSEEEAGWVSAYTKLSHSRIKTIEQKYFSKKEKGGSL